jgi:hypothetical protein
MLSMRHALALVLLCACGSNPAPATDPEFGSPQRVSIRGLSDHAMEPFLTRDGRFLLFNNSNDPPEATDLHYAERVDDVTFEYRGKLTGANSATLDGVPTVDSAGNIYFVSLRSYETTLKTIFRGRFENGRVSGVEPVEGLSRSRPGDLNFDVEVSADGNSVYFVDGVFRGGPVPSSADLAFAVRQADGSFVRREGLLDSVNSRALEYAACISNDERELFFTRVDRGGPAIYRSTRSSGSSPWGMPRRLSGITGFVEAPTISADGRSLYYHARRDGRLVIERAMRN